MLIVTPLYPFLSPVTLNCFRVSRCGSWTVTSGSPVFDVPSRLQRGTSEGTKQQTAPSSRIPLPKSLPTPPTAYMPTGLPELSEDDIAAFLEQAREITQHPAHIPGAAAARAPPLPTFEAPPATEANKNEVKGAPASSPRFAQKATMTADQRAAAYAAASAAAAQFMQSASHFQMAGRATAKTNAKGKAGARSRTRVKDEEGPEWKYKDIKSPPDWLQYTHTQGGLPTTKPPAVPRMIPPPPPQAFPQFSYARPPGGPYSPPPVPTYSISSPPPVAASTWLPLAAYIQPPSDQPNPAE